MDFEAIVKFIGVVDGEEITYLPGDTIPAADANEMNLPAKVEIAQEVEE